MLILGTRSISERHLPLSSAPTCSFRSHPAAVQRVDHPVVQLKGVHGLKDGTDPPNVVVDLSIVYKLCSQVTIQLGLNLQKQSLLKKKTHISRQIFAGIFKSCRNVSEK